MENLGKNVYAKKSLFPGFPAVRTVARSLWLLWCKWDQNTAPLCLVPFD